MTASVKAQDSSPFLVIRGGTLIDGTGAEPVKDAIIVVNGDLIEAIGPDAKIRNGAREIDATGKFIVPGFLDARVRIGPTPANHLKRSEIAIPQRLDSLRGLLTGGVTTARLIQGSLLEQELYRRWAQDDLLASPRILASGPVFTGKTGHPLEEYSVLALGARDRETREITDEDLAREKSREVAHAEADSFEIVYDQGPEGHRRPRLAKSALEILLTEAQGHDLASFCEVGADQEAADAAEAGASAIEGVWDEALSENTLALMVKKSVYFVPVLTQQGDLLNLLDEVKLKAYLDDALVQQSLSNIMKQSLASSTGAIPRLRIHLSNEGGKVTRQKLEEQQKRAFENVRKARGAGVKIAVGTGAGNLLIFPGASLHRELQLLVQAGLTPMEAIVAATQNTATSLGHSKEVGTIEAGKKADFLILDADPLVDIRNTEKIQEVIWNGQEIRWEDYPPR
jgi:imidazolonepropionase-like amidohydrolase